MQLSNREAIYLALQQVPKGKVVTYGQLAALANLPRAARLVGHVLHNLPEATLLPWHRVVNAQGKLSLPPDSTSYREQLNRLTAEGVIITRGKINLNQFGWLI